MPSHMKELLPYKTGVLYHSTAHQALNYMVQGASQRHQKASVQSTMHCSQYKHSARKGKSVFLVDTTKKNNPKCAGKPTLSKYDIH